MNTFIFKSYNMHMQPQVRPRLICWFCSLESWMCSRVRVLNLSVTVQCWHREMTTLWSRPHICWSSSLILQKNRFNLLCVRVFCVFSFRFWSKLTSSFLPVIGRFDEIVKRNKVEYHAGGSTQNSVKIAQVSRQPAVSKVDAAGVVNSPELPPRDLGAVSDS